MAVRRIRRQGVMFEFDDRDFDAIRKGADVRRALRSIAETAAARARASAPVDSGAYRDSIRVEEDDSGSRAQYRVVAGAPHATVVESRTGNLKRALG